MRKPWENDSCEHVQSYYTIYPVPVQQQLWNIANTLRGKMNADEFRDYILGFIFYKYLSEKIQRFCDTELEQENLTFADINESTAKGQDYIAALEEAALDELGYGTSIPTCVLVFKKCRKHPDNILFIDASQHFDKVKTQNILRPEHIQKVVAAYKARTNQDKYSHVASIASIKANDYNLNIPRYVDTFEAEEAIDLNTIAVQLAALEQSSKITDATIAAFCQELGIAPPFAQAYASAMNRGFHAPSGRDKEHA